MPVALLDTNVLVYAAYRRSPLHGPASQLVEEALKDRRRRYCIAPQNLVEFCAVATRPRFVNPPLAMDEVLRMTSLLYRSRRLAKIYPRRGTVSRTVREGAILNATGTDWYDLYLAMTMREAGVKVIITENIDDFRRFPFVTARRIQQALAE
jgi:predicted nucleic acid-binding protein